MKLDISNSAKIGDVWKSKEAKLIISKDEDEK